MTVARRGITRHDVQGRRPTEWMVTTYLSLFDSMGVRIFRHGRAPRPWLNNVICELILRDCE
jgi:hypothetical protein